MEASGGGRCNMSVARVLTRTRSFGIVRAIASCGLLTMLAMPDRALARPCHVSVPVGRPRLKCLQPRCVRGSALSCGYNFNLQRATVTGVAWRQSWQLRKGKSRRPNMAHPSRSQRQSASGSMWDHRFATGGATIYLLDLNNRAVARACYILQQQCAITSETPT